MKYIPTPEPLPGEQWTPSNGTEGYAFIDAHCCHCARDKPSSEGKPVENCNDDELCQILAASFRDEAVEWRRMPDGAVKCIAFVQAGEPIPVRDDRTTEIIADVMQMLGSRGNAGGDDERSHRPHPGKSAEKNDYFDDEQPF